MNDIRREVKEKHRLEPIKARGLQGRKVDHRVTNSVQGEDVRKVFYDQRRGSMGVFI